MARYIDADKVMEEIARIGGHNLCEWETIGVKALINRQPTADVAPRAEVAREIFEKIITTTFETMPPDILLVGKDEDFTDGVRFGKRAAVLDMINNLAELKKKYTEDKPNDNK